jgi:GntR family transcriptional regulator
MIISVDGESPVPPYEQIRGQIVTMSTSGVLPADTRLPSIRQLAADLAVAPGTVARAYRELEVERVIVTKGRHGTFVVGPPELSRRERDRRLASEAVKYAQTADQLGATSAETLSALRRALHL